MRSPRHDHELRPGQPVPRLRQQGGDLARLLDEADRDYRKGLDEAAAWRRLGARPGRRRLPAVLVPVTACVAAAVLLWLLPISSRDDGAIIVSGPPAGTELLGMPPAPPPVLGRQAAPTPIEMPDAPPSRLKRLVPTPAPLPLPAGRSTLSDGSEIELSAHARAELRGRVGESTTLALLSGSVELKVAPQPLRTFEVAARAVRFRVLGTRFRVTLEQDEPTLEVSEGTVAVVEGDAVIARVTAGGRWSRVAAPVVPSVIPPPPPPPPAATTVAPAPAPQARFERPAPPSASLDAEQCLAMARAGRGRDAIQCLQPLGAGNGLSAEMAMYEIARLQRDVLGDLPAALATLQRCAARFPHGALQAEVRVSEIDLLARSGRADEALAASGRLLASAGGRERAAELHLLRGNLLRDRLGDCGQALREYASAEENAGAVGAEAALGRARCLERQGRSAEAAAAYRACIERGHARTAADARRYLQAMQGE